jgi:hypothetical protein
MLHRSGKFRGDALHLGKVFIDGGVVLVRVIES